MPDMAGITKFESLRGFGFARVEARPDRSDLVKAFFHVPIWPLTGCRSADNASGVKWSCTVNVVRDSHRFRCSTRTAIANGGAI